MNRRSFIKNSCLACAGMAGISVLLDSCQPLPIVRAEINNNSLLVSKSGFTEKNNILIVRAPQLENDILLIRTSTNDYRALLMQCTHQNNPLVATSKSLFCNSHGSSFSLEGKVQQGPAIKDLKTFKTEAQKENVLIHLT